METEEQRKRINRYVAISFILHLSIFLLCSVGSFFVAKPLLMEPTIHVDMVALPNQVKNSDQPPPDVSLPVKPNPPPPPPEASKPEPDVMVKQEKPPPQPVAKKPEPVKPREDDLALERKKELEAKKRAEAALKRMREQLKKEREAEEAKKQAALEKRKKDLAKFEQKYREAIRGNQKNEGTSLTGQMQATLNAYVGAITDKIRSNWALPTYLQSQNLSAKIVIHIDARGNVVEMAYTRSSGNTMFDGNAERAIRDSSPLPPPPAEMASKLRSGGIEVKFPL